ncbi:hypothetical protein [Rhizobium mayense]|uniref:Entry exclusion lipoprotein TrbK n=1 Tax=Rhizobium mayense TaxID=1312184 RepID=A0ABT7JQC8_9HYPH|nr:hypothetical protein [Rhizobium mayense]MDL2398456.1 hypothetical protein [Rhizobium mayense]
MRLVLIAVVLAFSLASCETQGRVSTRTVVVTPKQARALLQDAEKTCSYLGSDKNFLKNYCLDTYLRNRLRNFPTEGTAAKPAPSKSAGKHI